MAKEGNSSLTFENGLDQRGSEEKKVFRINCATIITDCGDDNARARIQARIATLMGATPIFIPILSTSPEIECAVQLVDSLDACNNTPISAAVSKLVIANVAPRLGSHDNGAPFCYFHVGNTLVVSTFSSYCLSLVRELAIADHIFLLDVVAVTEAAASGGLITSAHAHFIQNSQFRSLEFVPLVAFWLLTGQNVPAARTPIPATPIPPYIWFIDCFGNCKTTLLPQNPSSLTFPIGDHKLPFCTRLTDAPLKTPAVVIGSSGYSHTRFLEIVVRGGSAAAALNLAVGPVPSSIPCNNEEPHQE